MPKALLPVWLLFALASPLAAMSPDQRRDEVDWMRTNLPDVPAWNDWQKATGTLPPDFDAQIAKLDKGLGELNKAFADAQSTKDALLKTNETLGKEKLELMTARDTLQKQINELGEKIKALTDQNKGQQGTLQSLQQEKNVLAQQFKTVKTEIDAMAHQRDSLKGERDQFQGACNELMAKLQQLTEKVKNLEKDFISLNDVRAEAAGFVSAPR